jgi:MFS family permease
VTAATEPGPASQASGRWAHGLAAPVLVFCTSAVVLVLEILAGRLVAPYVGVSLETYTGIIGTVLAGIAAGSALGGWVADRSDPRRLLGPLLMAAGTASLASLPVVAALGPAVAAGGGGPGGVVTLAVTAFVVPTALLSAVTPMVAKLRLASTARTGVVVGGLSAAGTAGALVGTFATGFVFVAAWPTRPIVVAIGAALVASGLVLAVAQRRRPRAGALAALLVAPALAYAVPSPCQEETRYYCVDVVADPARPSGRTLVLDDLRHSYVDLDDATHLEFRYTRLFAAVVEAVSDGGAVDALHIGGGGFTFPGWLAATRPGSTSTVLELDPEVVRIARQQLGLVTSPALRVRTGDARVNITAEQTDGYDLVVGDAFGGLSVPWHLTTVEMVEEIDRTLRAGGVYVLNMIDAGPRRLVRAEAATLAAVFDHVAVIVPPDGPAGNHVLAGSDEPFRLDDVATGDGTVLAGPDAIAFIADADALTDDHAPADQLLTRD